jgi:hypothetical protein
MNEISFELTDEEIWQKVHGSRIIVKPGVFV